MVHDRPRYIVGYMPRVKGKAPGVPNRSPASQPSRSEAVYTGLISMPESVRRVSLAMAPG